MTIRRRKVRVRQVVAPPAAAVAKKGAAAPKQPAATKPAAPVAKKIEPPAKPAAPAAAKPAAPVAAKPAAPVAKPLPPSLVVRDSSLAHPNLDSTQTIRALTNEEMSDAAQDKWFAIQLAASDQPVNLDTMPHLDIFEAYSLYSVATAGSGKIVHSLRLGFFKEAVSAEAVTGYLKTFFASPTVLRISVAEQARFKDAPQPRRADAGRGAEEQRRRPRTTPAPVARRSCRRSPWKSILQRPAPSAPTHRRVPPERHRLAELGHRHVQARRHRRVQAECHWRLQAQCDWRFQTECHRLRSS